MQGTFGPLNACGYQHWGEEMDTPTQDTRLAIPVAEAARRLSVGQRSIYRAIQAGTLPHLKFGRRLVIPLEALRAYAAAAYEPGGNDGPAPER